MFLTLVMQKLTRDDSSSCVQDLGPALSTAHQHGHQHGHQLSPRATLFHPHLEYLVATFYALARCCLQQIQQGDHSFMFHRGQCIKSRPADQQKTGMQPGWQ